MFIWIFLYLIILLDVCAMVNKNQYGVYVLQNFIVYLLMKITHTSDCLAIKLFMTIINGNIYDSISEPLKFLYLTLINY